MRVVGRSNARGFSLVEMVVAIAIAVLLGWLLFHALSQALLAGRLQAARDAEQNSIGQLTDHLTNEEDDAWAIYVPPSDIFGASNGDGHEVDFFTRDGKRQSYFWAYDYDAGTQTVYRYRFSSPGGIPTKDTSYSGIAKFYAHTYPLTALQDPSTPVYSTLYNGANLRSGIVHFYPAMPWIAGGNNITYVHFEGATIKQDLELVTQTAPSGFTIVLSYTPSPSPAPTVQPTPVVWPAAIQFAAPGTTIAPAASQAMTAPRYRIAAALNALLGGTIAQAQVIPRGGCRLDCPTPGPRPTINRTPTPPPTLPPTSPPIFISPTPQPTPTLEPATPTPAPSPTATPTPVSVTPAPGNGCSAVAYADADMKQPLPANATNPYTGQVVVDANGCYIGNGSSASFTVHEDNYSGNFFDGPNDCGSGVKFGTWFPSNAQGPTAEQFMAAGSTAGSCVVTFSDASGKTVSGNVAVEFPNPMYTLVYQEWAEYEYCPSGSEPTCPRASWVPIGGGASWTEYMSTDQGATWSTVCSSTSGTCGQPAQFTHSVTSCTQDKAGAGPCGAGGSRSTDTWNPYAPPNPPGPA